MNAVLQRELVVQARQARTYWLRFFAGLSLAAVVGLNLATLGDLANAMGVGRAGPTGAELFAALHTVISLLLFVTAPLVAADCIARERREGTLGLLALTPLRPDEIVVGKVGAHVIRLVSLWLVSLPVLMVPVLLGGVNSVDVKCALGVEFTVLCGGLAAGMIASTFGLRWNSVAALAAVLTVLIGQTVASGLGLAMVLSGQGGGFSLLADHWTVVVFKVSMLPWAAATGMIDGGFSPMLSRGLPATLPLNAALVSVGVLILGLLLASVWFSGRRVAHLLRRDAGAPERRSRFLHTMFVQLARRAPSRLQRQRWLSGNPARWLFAHSSPVSGGRWLNLAAIGALGVVGLVGVVRYQDPQLLLFIAVFQVLVLAAAMAFEVAASFRRELEEGTLELLLVTGLPGRDLVRGRVAQIWAASGTPVAVSGGFLLIALLAGTGQSSGNDGAIMWWLCGACSVFGAVPIGIRYAVRRLNPLHGWFWTMLTTVFPPLLLGGATAMMFWGLRRGGSLSDEDSSVAFFAGFALTQFALGRTWLWLAANDLQTRMFMLKPFQRRAR